SHGSPRGELGVRRPFLDYASGHVPVLVSGCLHFAPFWLYYQSRVPRQIMASTLRRIMTMTITGKLTPGRFYNQRLKWVAGMSSTSFLACCLMGVSLAAKDDTKKSE